ncbi:hypothetical protein QAD02_006141 [Eretmocerus hayati]|uniref:Uncharacterized protein n=1 Tax=Eretmocerus hayati TaxID=131215 RepID=A0ACC2N057_9HYME|nr:hypothetical protein QAD02_006141 [Eretmocerus hayati]
MLRPNNREQEAAELDRRFEETLARLKPYLLQRSPGSSAKLCRQWLVRLNKAHNQRHVRNQYALELCKQLIAGRNSPLRAPFDKPPPSHNVQLVPIASPQIGVQRPVTSSSCNEFTETSVSPREHQRLSWANARRSRSLRRGFSASAAGPHEPHFVGNSNLRRSFDAHSSSPGRTPDDDDEDQMGVNNLAHGPVRCRTEQDNRCDTRLLLTYRERLETLSNIVEELEAQNEKLRQKITYYQSISVSDETPQLHSRIRQLMAEITGLKKKLKDVYELKEIMLENHNELVEQYKSKLTAQFNKVKQQLENARGDNQNLKAELAKAEQKLKQLCQEKEEVAKSNDENWEEKFGKMQAEYERTLKEKEEQIRKKDEVVRQKESELAEKLEQIGALSEKIKELQQLINVKPQEDESLQSVLVDQFKTLRDELSTMKSCIELVSKKQDETLDKDMSSMKKSLTRLEKSTLRAQHEYEKKIYHILKEKEREIATLQAMLTDQQDFKPLETTDDKLNLSCETGTTHHHVHHGSFNDKYKQILNSLEITADHQRCKYYKRLAFLENTIGRLHRTH